MKFLKILGVVIAIGIVFYSKNKIDKRNKTQSQTIDSLEDDGTSVTKEKKK